MRALRREGAAQQARAAAWAGEGRHATIADVHDKVNLRDEHEMKRWCANSGYYPRSTTRGLIAVPERQFGGIEKGWYTGDISRKEHVLLVVET